MRSLRQQPMRHLRQQLMRHLRQQLMRGLRQQLMRRLRPQILRGLRQQFMHRLRQRLGRLRSGRLPAQPCINFGNIRPILRLSLQAPRHDLSKGGRQIGRHHHRARTAEHSHRLSPRERFAEGDAERPHITGGGTNPITRFGWVIHRQRFDIVHFAHRPNGVTRELQLIADHQHVRRLQAPENQIPLVQECQRTQRRHEHLACLGFRERSMLEKLREILIGVFHHRIQIADASDIAASHVQQRHQVRMPKRRRRVPACKLRLNARRRQRDELQRNFRRRKLRRLNEEDRAVIGAAEETTQREPALDDLPLQPRPDPADRRTCFCAHGWKKQWIEAPLYNHQSAVSSLSPVTDASERRASFTRRQRPEMSKRIAHQPFAAPPGAGPQRQCIGSDTG